ncbi:hypothetical protein D5S17_34970 [Pseudonocardiaceae bacterium YIM PH 21723]|nr:hypothetical protein D5S17_34970 [Pseudonocardiaceae bacterium YIM PH 21723]
MTAVLSALAGVVTLVIADRIYFRPVQGPRLPYWTHLTASVFLVLVAAQAGVAVKHWMFPPLRVQLAEFGGGCLPGSRFDPDQGYTVRPGGVIELSSREGTVRLQRNHSRTDLVAADALSRAVLRSLGCRSI